jgi:hypothetical protein
MTDFYSPFSIKNVQECRCASANCRGVLGPKPPPTKEQKKEVIKPLVKHAKRKLKQYLNDEKGGSSTLRGLKKRGPAVATSKKGSLIAPAKATSKTTLRGSMRRKASSTVPSRAKRQTTNRSLKSTFTPSPGTRSTRLQKSALRRVMSTVKSRTPATGDTISVRSSPRKKVKTFKAAEAAEVVKVVRKQSNFKIAASRVKRGVVRNAKGSKARAMGRGRRGRRVS